MQDCKLCTKNLKCFPKNVKGGGVRIPPGHPKYGMRSAEDISFSI